jgi:hypothetical protein
MTPNLVSLVLQYATPEMIGRIATAFGLDRSSANTAVSASVPGLLAALSSAAMQPGGAQKLADAAMQHVGAPDKLASILAGGTQTTVADKGARFLSSLLGGQDHAALAAAVAKVAGVSQGASNSLLGVLAPVVLGTIAKQQGAGGLNPSNIVSLLSAQKDNIAAALPSGLRNQLSGTGMLDSLRGVVGAATATAGEGTRAAISAAQTVTNTGVRAASGAIDSASARPKWLYWAIPAAAVAALVLYLINNPLEQVAQHAPQVTGSVQSVVIGGLDMGKQVSDSLAGLRTSLVGITDAASATAVQSKLQQITIQLDKVSDVAAQLSPDQRKIIAGIVKPAMQSLNQQFDKVLVIPGASDVLKPSIDVLKAKLATLSVTT